MKKNIILLLVMLLSAVSANAENWQPISTSFPDTKLYIDLDSVKYPQEDECLYALKYQVAGNPEKIAYIKSNLKTNYLGIIRVVDSDTVQYRPVAELNEPHVFMKQIPENSFLNDVQRYASALGNGYALASDEFTAEYRGQKPLLRDDLVIAYNEQNPYYTNASVQSYLVRTCKQLEANWQPPATTHATRNILYVTIGRDGSLLDYKMIEGSGDDTTDRSVISAAERTVPYAKLPNIGDNKEVYSMDFKFVFEHDMVRKSVVY